MNNVQDALLVEVHADQANHGEQADALILPLSRGNSFRHVFDGLLELILLGWSSEDDNSGQQHGNGNEKKPGPAQFIH